MAQKTKQRASEILHLLLHDGKTSIDELTQHFRTSSASVRRDLARLEQQGLVHRTRGGAMLANQTYEPFRFDASFTEREGRFKREKQCIARKAAELFQDGDTAGITAGTTTTLVARALSGRRRLRVLTNAVNIGLELSASNNPDITLTGGDIKWPGAFSLTGAAALETIGHFILDRVLIGVTGIDAAHGATMIEHEEAAVSRAFVQQAREVIVVADSSKVGMTSQAVVCNTHQIDILITDSGVSRQYVDDLEKQGVRVVVAE